MVERYNVLGVGVHALDMPVALDLIEQALRSSEKRYVCLTAVHVVMEAQRNPALRTILNRAFLTIPDGMPLVWIARLRGLHRTRRVYGPDLMKELCNRSMAHDRTHFLYGGTAGTAERLRCRLEAMFPGIRIVGTYEPPFRPLRPRETTQLLDLVNRARPDIVWIGLSTPGKESFMAEYLAKLETRLMVGVGAAFDILSGRRRDAPDWVKRAGLQWVHRLMQEPRRLWRRSLVDNPVFVCKSVLQLSGMKAYPVDS